MAAQVVRRHHWCQLAPYLGRALGTPAEAETLRRQFEAGTLHGWQTPTATLLTRIEGTELVLVALEGRDLAPLLRHVIAKARAAGLATLRAHTQRPGLLRLAQRVEPSIHRREIVLGLEL